MRTMPALVPGLIVTAAFAASTIFAQDLSLPKIPGTKPRNIVFILIPLQPDRGGVNNLRRKDGAKPAEFPTQLYRER